MISKKIVQPNSDEEFIKLFSDAINNKQIVLAPCETIYCLHFDAMDEKLKERVYEIKGRAQSKKFTTIIPDVSYLEKAGIIPNDLEKEFMKMYWPGFLTIAFTDEFAASQTKTEWLNDSLKKSNYMVAATSANISGEPAVTRASEINQKIIDKVDLVLIDDSKNFTTDATTVVRLKGKVEILRQGVIDIPLDKKMKND